MAVIGKIYLFEKEGYNKKIKRDFYEETIEMFIFPDEPVKENLKKLENYSYYILYMEDEGISQGYVDIGENKLLLIFQNQDGVYSFEEVDYQDDIEKKEILEASFQGYGSHFIDEDLKTLKSKYVNKKKQLMTLGGFVAIFITLFYLINLTFFSPEDEEIAVPQISFKPNIEQLTDEEKFIAGILVFPEMVNDIYKVMEEVAKDKEHSFIWSIYYKDISSYSPDKKEFKMTIDVAYDYPAKNTIKTEIPPYKKEIEKSYVYVKNDILVRGNEFPSYLLSKECLDVILSLNPLYVEIDERNLAKGDLITISDEPVQGYRKDPLPASVLFDIIDTLIEKKCPVYPVEFFISPEKKILKFRILEASNNVFIKR